MSLNKLRANLKLNAKKALEEKKLAAQMQEDLEAQLHWDKAQQAIADANDAVYDFLSKTKNDTTKPLDDCCLIQEGKRNDYLFKMVDSIILEYYDETEGKLLSALENNEELSTVPNLIYKSDDEIHMTSYKANRKNYVPIFQTQHSISDLANVHLHPYNMCYWNKCTFCGINKKYHFNNDDSTENALETSLNYLIEHLHKEKEPYRV